MKQGDKLTVVRNDDYSQCYIPIGESCEYIRSFDNYVCVSYGGREFLLNKAVVVGDLGDEGR